MSNNPAIFNAATAGAAGGAANRWIIKKASSDYNGIAQQVLLFATAVDAQIATTTVTDAEVNLMQSICSQVVASRWFPSSLVLANYTNIAQAITAMWTRLKQNIEPIPTTETDLYTIDDDFDVGNSSSGLISTTAAVCTTGAGNWQVKAQNSTGNFQGGAGQLEHPGIFRFFTGASTNDAVCVNKNQIGQNTGSIFAENISSIEAIWTTNFLTTSKIEVGAAVLDATYQATSQFMEVKYDTSLGPNLLFIGGTSPPVDTGFTPPAILTFMKTKMVRTANDVKFYLNDVFAGSVLTPPTGLVSTFFRIQTLAGGSRTINMDAYRMTSTPLAR